jgi:hypothetical protein
MNADRRDREKDSPDCDNPKYDVGHVILRITATSITHSIKAERIPVYKNAEEKIEQYE